MELVICVRHYDYFGGDKTDHEVYTNLLEGWEELKKSRSYDFVYDNAFRATTYYVRHDYTVELKPQRWHARSKYEWDKMREELEKQKFRDEHMGLDKAEYNFLMMLNALDENIII